MALPPLCLHNSAENFYVVNKALIKIKAVKISDSNTAWEYCKLVTRFLY